MKLFKSTLKAILSQNFVLEDQDQYIREFLYKLEEEQIWKEFLVKKVHDNYLLNHLSQIRSIRNSYKKKERCYNMSSHPHASLARAGYEA